jgi:hypothetical protein
VTTSESLCDSGPSLARTSKTRGQLLREKVDNLAKYCCSLKPEKANELLKLKQASDEEIIYWIVHDILPRQQNLYAYVDEWLKLYQIEPSDAERVEIRNKLYKYCKFFVVFMNK